MDNVFVLVMFAGIVLFILYIRKNQREQKEILEKKSDPLEQKSSETSYKRESTKQDTIHKDKPVKLSKNAEYYVSEGNRFSKMGDKKNAISSYKSAIEIDPNSCGAYQNLGSSLCELGNFEEGIKYLSHATKLAPENPEILRNYGYALYLSGELHSAIKQYEKALGFDPSHLIVRLYLSDALKDTGNLLKAKEQLTFLIDIGKELQLSGKVLSPLYLKVISTAEKKLEEFCKSKELNEEIKKNIVEQLAIKMSGDNDNDFVSGLKSAVEMADSGDKIGVIAIEEAIRKRARVSSIEFYSPGLAVVEIFDTVNAPDAIIQLAKDGDLLKDVKKTGSLIVKTVSGYGQDRIKHLAREVAQVSNKNQGYAILLIYNQIVNKTPCDIKSFANNDKTGIKSNLYQSVLERTSKIKDAAKSNWDNTKYEMYDKNYIDKLEKAALNYFNETQSLGIDKSKLQDALYYGVEALDKELIEDAIFLGAKLNGPNQGISAVENLFKKIGYFDDEDTLIDVLKIFLDYELDINTKSETFFPESTLLYRAAFSNKPKVTKFLIDNGAEIGKRDSSFDTFFRDYVKFYAERYPNADQEDKNKYDIVLKELSSKAKSLGISIQLPKNEKKESEFYECLSCGAIYKKNPACDNNSFNLEKGNCENCGAEIDLKDIYNGAFDVEVIDWGPPTRVKPLGYKIKNLDLLSIFIFNSEVISGNYANYSRDLLSKHLSNYERNVLDNNFHVLSGDLLPNKENNLTITISNDFFNSNLEFLPEKIKTKVSSSEPLGFTAYLLGIFAVKKEKILAVAKDLKMIVDPSYCGVVIFDLPNPSVIKEIANGLGLDMTKFSERF